MTQQRDLVVVTVPILTGDYRAEVTKMSLLLLFALAASLAWPASCKPLPVVVPVTKDTATSLYTIPFNDGANLVLDIAGPLVWSTC